MNDVLHLSHRAAVPPCSRAIFVKKENGLPGVFHTRSFSYFLLKSDTSTCRDTSTSTPPSYRCVDVLKRQTTQILDIDCPTHQHDET